MFWQGLIFWYDNYGLWPWQAKPRPKTVVVFFQAVLFSEFKRLENKHVDPDEVAHHEPPHLDLHCLQSPLVSFFCALNVKTCNSDGTETV